MGMSRRRFLATSFAAALAAGPAFAIDDPATRSVVRQLERQGFEITSVSRTLLGRVRVVARRGDIIREIVFDPRNGAILRDYTTTRSGEPRIGPSPEGGGAGDDDDDDNDDDDDDDDGDDGSDDDSDDGDDDGDDGGDDDD
jgi:hypothetical protein